MKEIVNFKGLMMEIRICVIEESSFHEVMDSLTDRISLYLLFLVKSQDNLHGNKGVKLNFFSLFVNYGMKRPVIVTWAIPKI